MKTLLVTGGAGFIGSNYILHRRRISGDRIVNIDKLTYAGNLENLATLAGDPSYTFVRGDIGDSALVERLLREHRPDAIVHFAAESHVDRSIVDPDAFIQTNIVGTFRLLEAVRRYWEASGKPDGFRFHHISTDEVFGSLGFGDPAFTERSPYAPNSPYAASKAASDHLVRAYHATYGLPVVVTNCSNNYGPCQFPEKLIPLTILNALEGKPIPVYGDGGYIRDWLWVGDHVEALGVVLDRGRTGETYAIGGGCEKSVLEVVRTVCDILDRMSPDSPSTPHTGLIAHVADRPGHDRRYAIDAGKIAAELGWKPSTDFQRGMEITVRWYMDNSRWVDSVRSGEYRQWIETNYDNRR